MKIAFMGTPEFAIPPLERLLESRHEVALVVTQPSKPKGRGRKVVDPPVKRLAEERGIPVLQPRSLKKEPIDERIRGLGIDVVVVVAYGKILPDALLEAPRLGCINIHASLLPEYRGAAPVQRALMDGRLETGVTIMKLETELDAGPVLARRRVPIHDDDDALSLANMLSVLGADMLLGVLDDVEKQGAIEGEPQQHDMATYAPPIAKEEGVVDWNDSPLQIMFKLRGLTPWPGLWTTHEGRRLRIVQAEPLVEPETRQIGANDDLPAGAVSGIMKEFGFAVRTGEGHLLVTKVQPEGKAVMDAAAYMNGRPVRVGQQLGVRQ